MILGFAGDQLGEAAEVLWNGFSEHPVAQRHLFGEMGAVSDEDQHQRPSVSHLFT